MASRKRTSTTKKSSRKPKTPAHPDLGKEFYVATTPGGTELLGDYFPTNDSTVAEVAETIHMNYGDEHEQRQCLIFKVRVVAVGVDESNPIDNRTWYK